MDIQQPAYKYVKLLAAMPILTCIVLLGHSYYSYSLVNQYIAESNVEQLKSSVEQNKSLTSENSQKIDEIYSQVVNEAITEFRIDDMQTWILKFRQENPDLHIPDIILGNQ